MAPSFVAVEVVAIEGVIVNLLKVKTNIKYHGFSVVSAEQIAKLYNE